MSFAYVIPVPSANTNYTGTD